MMKAEIKKDIVLALSDEYPRDMSIGELTKSTGRARDTIKKYLNHLEAEGYIKETRTVGRARMFAIGPKLQNFTGEDGGEAINDILRLVE
jgi:DNA-binding IclR family transcriptional regulator